MSALTQSQKSYTLVSEGIDSLSLPGNSVLITSEKLDQLYPLTTGHKILVPEGEAAKTLEVTQFCWEKMHQLGLDRHSTVVALGGGSITDLAGFVAATYMRGIPSIYIPTTLLGMVDAAIGGKTGVNLPTGKSIVGAFHQPRHVYILPETLNSLNSSQICCGMAEVIKYGIALDASLFYYLEEHGARPIEAIIERCCAIKSDIVSRDPMEQNLRSLLNYGHTFAHAIETATRYQRVQHGEAVAMGMHCAARTAQQLGWVNAAFVKRQKALIHKFKLPTELPSDLDPDILIALMKKDKKVADGKIRLILPKEIGTVSLYINTEDEFLKKVLMS